MLGKKSNVEVGQKDSSPDLEGQKMLRQSPPKAVPSLSDTNTCSYANTHRDPVLPLTVTLDRFLSFLCNRGRSTSDLGHPLHESAASAQRKVHGAR